MFVGVSLPWVIAGLSVLSNLIVDVVGEIGFEYGARFIKDWYTGSPGAVQAGCISTDIPATPEYAQSVIAGLDPAFFECAQVFYTGLAALPQ